MERSGFPETDSRWRLATLTSLREIRSIPPVGNEKDVLVPTLCVGTRNAERQCH